MSNASWSPAGVPAQSRAEQRVDPSGEHAMIIDHRTYTMHLSKLPKWLKLYEEHGLPVQQRHLGKLIGFFVSEIGPLNQVVHLWQNEELGALQSQENKILLPTAFSPLK